MSETGSLGNQNNIRPTASLNKITDCGVVRLFLSPVSWRRAAVVGSSPVMGGLALHNYVFPKFLPHQRTGYGTYQSIKSLHQDSDLDLVQPYNR